MKVSISPSVISGTVQAPASKSSMQRACAAALLSKGITTILHPGISNDDIAALDVITHLGATVISHTKEKLVVESDGVKPVASAIHCGESGLGIRMFTPLAALSDKELTINGSGSLTTRPLGFFEEIFPKLGVRIHTNNGRVPLVIKGPLLPTDIEIDGSLSSQFLTGLLMAYAAAGADGVEIKVNNLRSKPYIDLTLDVMRHFGVGIENDHYRSFRFFTVPAPAPSATGMAPEDFIVQSAALVKGFIPTTYSVEGDWSGGAFLLVAGAIGGKVIVKGLSPASAQADKEILKVLDQCGAIIRVHDESIECGSAPLKAFTFDATDCPDLFPPLVALAGYCEGVTTLKGVDRLAHKESNRGLTLRDEFGKMGVQIDINGDTMHIHGNRNIHGAVVHSRHDHRIAMACAVAAIGATGETFIEKAGAISKSYPDFYEDIHQLGVSINYKTEQL